MIFDQLLTLSDGMALTSLGSTVSAITPVPSLLDPTFINLSAVRDIGSGEQLSLHVHITEAVTGGDADRKIAFVISMTTSVGFANLQVLAKSGALAASDLYKGARFQVVIPKVQDRSPGSFLLAGVELFSVTAPSGSPPVSNSVEFTAGKAAFAIGMDTDSVIAIDKAGTKIIKVYPANATIT